jgi:hypothetical protein
MKSFEVMNTLFTRYCKKEDLFGYLEKNYPYPEFQSRRIEAECVARERKGPSVTLDDIYEVFKEHTLEVCPLETFDLLKEYEFSLEIENSIPIQSNINMIQEEDIFITDHYFTNNQLTMFFLKHAIEEKKLYRITDVNIPDTSIHIGTKKEKSNDRLTHAHEFTTIEELLYESPLIKQIRSFRLKNPYLDTDTEYTRYNEQATSSLPILLLFCIHVKKIMVKENRNKVLFCNPGLFHMFSLIYPDSESILFSSSSQIHLHPTPSYKEYVQKLYQEKTTLIVSLHGFFKIEGYRYRELFGHIPRVHVLVHELQCEFPSLSSCIESSQLSMDYIDSLSYDSRGVLFSMIEGIELRLHQIKPTVSLDILKAFSKEFVRLEPMDLDIPIILLQMIETCSK